MDSLLLLAGRSREAKFPNLKAERRLDRAEGLGKHCRRRVGKESTGKERKAAARSYTRHWAFHSSLQLAPVLRHG